MSIHPTAIIHKEAKIHSSVEIGAYAIIDKDVIIEKNVKISPQVYITGNTYVGEGCCFYKGAVIGEAPQDVQFKNGIKSGVKIGKNNIFREYVQIHRSKVEGQNTIIGDNNFFMASSHIAHDCKIGNNIVICNGALLAGHVIVEDNAFVSGNVTVHQYVRLGQLSFLQGLTAVSKDVVPFMIVGGINTVISYNVIGLKRLGYSEKERRNIKNAYNILYRKGYPIAKAVELLKDIPSESVNLITDFINNSSRGICTKRGKDATRQVEELVLA